MGVPDYKKMYNYQPKQKQKSKKNILIMLLIWEVVVGAWYIQPTFHELVDYMHSDKTIYIKNEVEEKIAKYDPCELSSVVCEGEISKKIELVNENSPEAIKRLIQLQFGEHWKLAWAVMMSEGRNNIKAFNPTNNSNDRGLYQISQRWHGEVSDNCAYNAECNIKEAYRISKGGIDWSPWYGYLYGGYLKFM